MFYSHTVLNIKSGKLAVVWLCATNHLKYDKRQDRNFKQVMAVGIDKTCHAILNYVKQKVPSDIGGSQPKFSLYLSAMLMHGTVKIYRRQMRSLLDDVNDAFMRLQSQTLLIQTSLLDTSLPVIGRATLLDTLDGGDIAPEFGILEMSMKTRSILTEPSFLQPTPRKYKGDDHGRSILRSSTADTSQDDVLMQLFNDWVEATPTRARPEDITLLEVDTPRNITATSIEPISLQEIQVDTDNFGPPFILPDIPLAEISENVIQDLHLPTLTTDRTQTPKSTPLEIEKQPTKTPADVARKLLQDDEVEEPKAKKRKTDAEKTSILPKVSIAKATMDAVKPAAPSKQVDTTVKPTAKSKQVDTTVKPTAQSKQVDTTVKPLAQSKEVDTTVQPPAQSKQIDPLVQQAVPEMASDSSVERLLLEADARMDTSVQNLLLDTSLMPPPEPVPSVPERERLEVTPLHATEVPQVVVHDTSDSNMSRLDLNETPLNQPTVPQPLLQRKSSTAPSSDPEVTPATAPRRESTSSGPSQIMLSPVNIEGNPQRRRKRKRLAIDELCQIPTEVIREQTQYQDDILRCQSPIEDRINVHIAKNIIPAAKLFSSTCHHRTIAKVLSNRLTNNYSTTAMSPASDGIDRRARRQLQLMRDEEVPAPVEAIQVGVFESTSTSSIRTPNVSMNEESGMNVPTAEGTLQVIQEEAIVVEPPERPDEIQISRLMDDMPPPLPPAAPSPKRKKTSPEGGLTKVTVTADIHQPLEPVASTQPFMEVQEEVIPTQNLGESLSMNGSLSATSSSPRSMPYSQTAWVLATKNRQTSLLADMEDYKGSTIIFDQCLPPNPNRLDAATLFYDLLCLHKHRHIELDQEENYGTIAINIL